MRCIEDMPNHPWQLTRHEPVSHPNLVVSCQARDEGALAHACHPHEDDEPAFLPDDMSRVLVLIAMICPFVHPWWWMTLTSQLALTPLIHSTVDTQHTTHNCANSHFKKMVQEWLSEVDTKSTPTKVVLRQFPALLKDRFTSEIPLTRVTMP